MRNQLAAMTGTEVFSRAGNYARAAACHLAYGAAGNVIEAHRPGGVVFKYGYDAKGHPVSIQHGNLVARHFKYDDKGRVLVEASADGENHLDHYYDDASSRTITTDAFGAKTTLTYETVANRKLVTRTEDALGHITQYAYDGSYSVVVATDTLGRVTHITRDADGNPTSVTDALGNTAHVEYQGRKEQGDGVGETTGSTGRPTKIVDALGGITRYRYNDLGNLTGMEDATGRSVSMEYDATGHLLSQRDGEGTVRYEYFSGGTTGGSLHAMTDALGRRVTFDRDEQSRPVTVTDAAGNKVTMQYDALNNVTALTDTAGNITKFDYTDGAGGPGSKLAKLTDALGNAYAFEYDKYGRLVKATNPREQSSSYTYDNASRLIAAQDAKAQKVAVEYDLLGRVAVKHSSEGDTKIAYDAVGNATNITGPTGSLGMAYDAANRVVVTTQSLSNGQSFVISYTYDAKGNRTAMQTPWGKYSYTYDAAGRMLTITSPDNKTVSFDYDRAGLRNKMTMPNGVETKYVYDAAKQLVSITHSKGKEVLAYAKYSYDMVGNRMRVEDTAGSHVYSYDSLSRLTQAVHTAGQSVSTESFTYDAVGNRLNDDKITDYRYDFANRLLETSQYVYVYDRNGNLTAKMSPMDGLLKKYAYTSANQLKEADLPYGTTVYFVYDPTGRRIEKDVAIGGKTNATRYIYDGSDIIAELDKDGHPIATYTNGPGMDQPLIMTKYDATGSTVTTQNYYYHADGLGSITALTDASGNIAERISYDAYGTPLFKNTQAISSPTATTDFIAENPYSYTGREYDKETGLFYYRARYYDATVGRFIQQDPIGFNGGDTDLYAYGANNSLNNIDPSGLSDLFNYNHPTVQQQGGDDPNFVPALIARFPVTYWAVATYGYWGGAQWSSAGFMNVNPKYPAADSLDECFKTHDLAYANNNITAGMDCPSKHAADTALMQCVNNLSVDPSGWTNPPTNMPRSLWSYLYRFAALKYFKGQTEGKQ